MKKWKVWAALVLAVLALIVVLQNTDTVQTEVLWVTVAMPRVLLLLVTLMVGVVVGILISDRLRKR